MNDKEYRALYKACRKLDDGPDYRMSNYALNLINTVLDFQSKAETVNNAMLYYQENIGYSSHRKLKSIVDQFRDTNRGNTCLAQHLWSNNMWTRAKFLRVLLREFEIRGIRGQRSLTRWLESADFERDVKGKFQSAYRINHTRKNHSLGIALFHWLCLRCGIDTIKPDVHIVNFVKSIIDRKAKPEECIEALVRIAREQNRECCRLDSAIWHLQRDRK